jgi:DNA-binding MarR family transcriptional regulator
VLSEKSSPVPYLFGDLLALSRLSWIRQMEARLQARGFSGYRRSDAMTMRLLARGPLAVGQLGERLGVTRQAARKLIDALEQSGYVRVERDLQDTRKLNATLTELGARYAEAVIETVHELNHELSQRVNPGQLAAADAVLRAAIAGDDELLAAARRVPGPSGSG